MTVYVVWEPGDDNGFTGNVNAVFTTREKAENYRDSTQYGRAYYLIEEKELDTEPTR